MTSKNSKVDTKKINEALSNIVQLEDSFNLLKENVLHGQKLIDMGSWTYDIKNDEMYRSDGLYRILDCSVEDLKHNFNSFYSFVHPEDLDKVRAVDYDFWEGKESDIEFRIYRKSGELRYIHEVTKVIRDEDGCPAKVVGIMQDITDRKLLEQRLMISNKCLEETQRLAHIGSWEINHIDNTVYWSDEAYRIHGIEPDQYENNFDFFFNKFIHPEDRDMILNILSKPSKEPVEMEFRIIREDGVIRYIFQRIEFIFDKKDQVTKIFGIVQDITEKRLMEKELEYKRNHDLLTGLLNRSYFTQYMDKLCRTKGAKNETFALLLFELDNFTYINDALGFQMGNKLISLVAERLSNSLEDLYICRYSGSIFAAILENVESIEECRQAAQRLIDTFSETFLLDIYEFDLIINLGISRFPEDGLDSYQLLKNADIAKMRSKNEGKNNYSFFSKEISMQSHKEYTLRRDMLYAIERDELRIFYQPVVNIKTNEIIGVEALVRWVHPVWGTLLPSEFIYIAEETDFIIHMGKWVLSGVCSTYKEWIESGLPRIKVGVNFSGIQFLENNFADKVIDIIERFGLDPSFLIMEITESVVMKKTDKVRADIERLQELGARLALDDFGTGFSSLSYISSFKIDVIKIAASFLHNLRPDSVNYSIIKFIGEMASSLDMYVVAEGVKTRDQLKEIKRLGCIGGQGYFFSKPEPKEEITKILKEGLNKQLLH
ncbi:MAG: EAL domain-containing protein [Caldicoprobacterales bacterium]